MTAPLARLWAAGSPRSMRVTTYRMGDQTMNTTRFPRAAALAGLLIPGLLIVSLMTVGLVPAAAQGGGLSAEELDMLAYITKAFDNFSLQASYAIEIVYNIEQTMSTTVGTREIVTAHNIIHQETAGVVVQEADPDPVTTALEMTQMQEATMESAGQDTVSIIMTIDLVVVDGTIYARISDIEPFIPALVSDWVNWSEHPEDFPGGGMLDVEGMTNIFSQIMLYPLNEQTVASIHEIEPLAEAGEDVIAFELTLDGAAVADVAGETLAGMFDASTMSGDPEAILRAMMEDMTNTTTLHIDVNTQLPVIVSSDTAFLVELPGQLTGSDIPILMDQAATMTVWLSDFGLPVEITAPDMD